MGGQLCKYDTECLVRARCENKHSDESDEAYAARVDDHTRRFRVKICKEWTCGSCTRENCMYAHGHEQLELQACRNRRCKNPKCIFLHQFRDETLTDYCVRLKMWCRNNEIDIYDKSEIQKKVEAYIASRGGQDCRDIVLNLRY